MACTLRHVNVAASCTVVWPSIGNRNAEGKVGQSVRYLYSIGGLKRQPGWDVYKITQLLPAEGDDHLYRVKSADEPHERVPRETELECVI
jgi:hypothetical protein